MIACVAFCHGHNHICHYFRLNLPSEKNMEKYFTILFAKTIVTASRQEVVHTRNENQICDILVTANALLSMFFFALQKCATLNCTEKTGRFLITIGLHCLECTKFGWNITKLIHTSTKKCCMVKNCLTSFNLLGKRYFDNREFKQSINHFKNALR
jgi:hypothetical protein